MKLLDNFTSKKACYKTKFKFHKNKKYISFKFVAYDSKFFSFSDKYNSELYRGDVCEIFINYGETNHYYEIEVAPNGAVFLADIINDGHSFKGTLIEKCFIKTSVITHKKNYVVKIKIPREYIKTDHIEFNAFRIDTDGGKENEHLFALHPTMCETFHKKDYIY